jgi:coenzyme F420-0:L-glutamate ligase
VVNTVSRWFSVYGLVTGLIRPGDPIADRLAAAAHHSGGMREGDFIVVAESAVATAEGRVVPLDSIEPTPAARALARRYAMDPRVVEIILQESDAVVGGMPGFLLCRVHGTLLPNAGVDASNAPPGCVVLLPADPEASAAGIRDAIRASARVEVAVIVADSRPHPMRSGCAGIALGCAGMAPVRDGRAVADSIASAAELVMGEADEGTPAAIVRWCEP